MNIKKIAFIAVSRYSLVGFTFLTSILIARKLGADAQGEILGMLLLPQLFSSLLSINFPEQFLFYWSKKDNGLKNNFLYFVISNIIYFFLILCVSFIFFKEQYDQVTLVIYSIGILSNNFSTISFRAVISDIIVNFSVFIQGLFLIGSVYTLIYLDFNIYDFIWCYIISVYIPVFIVFSALIMKKKKGINNGKVAFKSFIKHSILSHGSKVSLIIESNFDRYYIMSNSTSGELAFYSVSQSLSNLIGMLFQLPINVTVIPYLNNMCETKRWRATLNLFVKIQLIMLVLTFIFITFSNDIVTLLYGSEYATSVVEVLNILLIAVCFRMPVVCINYFIRSIQKTHEILKVTLISMPMNIFLCLILIPKYGIIGAAHASLVSYGVFSLMSYYMFYKYKNYVEV